MQIAVIGAGQLGSRHLQSLAGLPVPHTLHAIEPSPTSQALARERLGSAADRVNFHGSIAEAPEILDVAIVATGAAVRRRALTALLARCQVRYLLLEKILFPSVADCLWAQDLIAGCGVKAWVNFPRRMQPVYQAIHNSVVLGPGAKIAVTGSRWGLATSAVHFLDLALFLSQSPALLIRDFQIETYPSRHAGCLECVGSVAGTTQSGVAYSISATAEGNSPVEVVVENREQRWSIVEGDNQTLSRHAPAGNNRPEEVLTHPFYYQSQLTATVVDNLLKYGRCELADYDQALQSHLPFLRAWNRLLAPGSDPDSTPCPIT